MQLLSTPTSTGSGDRRGAESGAGGTVVGASGAAGSAGGAGLAGTAQSRATESQGLGLGQGEGVGWAPSKGALLQLLEAAVQKLAQELQLGGGGRRNSGPPPQLGLLGGAWGPEGGGGGGGVAAAWLMRLLAELARAWPAALAHPAMAALQAPLPTLVLQQSG